jgi:hypothetical protein
MMIRFKIKNKKLRAIGLADLRIISDHLCKIMSALQKEGEKPIVGDKVEPIEELDTESAAAPAPAPGFSFNFGAPVQFSGFGSLDDAYDQYNEEEGDEEEEEYDEEGEEDDEYEDIDEEAFIGQLEEAFISQLKLQGICPPANIRERIISMLESEIPQEMLEQLGYVDGEDEYEEEDEDEDDVYDDNEIDPEEDNEEDEEEYDEDEEGSVLIDSNDLVNLLVQQLMQGASIAPAASKSEATVEEVDESEVEKQ